jgi:apolipoprotein N-acyltransferase
VPRLRLTARPPLLLAIAAAVLSGALVAATFPPLGWWPAAFVALIPFCWALRTAGPRRGALLGLVLGLTSHGFTIYWIWRFGVAAWFALTIEMSLWAVALGVFAPGLRRGRGPFLTAAAWASWWVVLEWLRGLWPLGGFAWGTLGVSQVSNPATVRLATVTGVWGVSFVLVFVNVVLTWTLVDGGGARRRIVAVAIALAAALAPVVLPFGVPRGPFLRVAAIQVDVRQASGATVAAQDRRVAELNLAQHETLATGRTPDLVVWGEGALDPAAAADAPLIRRVREAIARVGAPTLIGAVLDGPGPVETTSALLFDGAGDLAGRYDKVHLVPYGEYVPFRDELSWIGALRQIPIDRTPGERVHTLETPGLPAFGTPICFENSFPAIPRAFVRDGAGFLVVPVNNASYGFTAASAQHEQMSQMRAVETGRWVVDAAVSGISAFIDPRGRVTAQAGLFEPAILRGTIRSSDERTWYVRLGDWLPWVALVFAAMVFAAPRRRRWRRPAPGPLPEGFRTLVILPTYDEAPTIGEVLDGVMAAPEAVDAIVVDDASPDGTGAIVAARAAAEPRIRLRQRAGKSGLASAYLEGFGVGLAEGYDLIVEMDSDLSHDPTELSILLHDAGTHDLTVGSRYIPGGSVTNWSRARLMLSRGGNAYTRVMLGIPLRDATSGFRVYRRDLLACLVDEPFASDGYGFQIELVRRAWRRGFDLGESPISFRERLHGHSKISRRIVVEALWLVTKWGVRDRFRGGASSEVEAP